MRALVTGAGGFIGPHLMSALILRRAEPIGLVRTSYSGAVFPFAGRTLAGDLTDGEFLQEVIRSGDFDMIFHLAARDGFSDPVELYRTNVLGTAALLEAVRNLEQPKLKVVLLGSSAQYGFTGIDPVTEKTGFNPITNYGISKVACEGMGRLLFNQTGQHVVCARPFNIIGPGQSPRLLQGGIVEQIIAIEAGRRPATVEAGDLSAHRDFLDVRDAAMGLIAIAEYGAAGEAYNICSGVATQVSKLVDCLVGLARTSVGVQSRERPGVANLPYQVGSYAKLKERANWAPRIPFEKSLEDALNERRYRACSAASVTVEGKPQ